MGQSEFKIKLDPETGRYTKQHTYGEGVIDVFKSFGSKLIGNTAKKAAKKGAEKALTTAATQAGEHVGKKAGDKIVKMLASKKKATPTRKKKVNETISARKISQQEINQRVNRIMSGGKII